MLVFGERGKPEYPGKNLSCEEKIVESLTPENLANLESAKTESMKKSMLTS